MSIEFRCVGLSEDRRANVWEVRCDCGKTFKPRTTTLAWQAFDCPKCGKPYVADWNKPSVHAA